MISALVSLFALAIQFPQPVGFVNDFAGIIPAGEQAQIEALCREIESKTTAEVAVATVKTVEPLTIEDYAVRLFENWGIGKKGKDNGALILVAVKDRKVRIEVGYGLEPVLTDAKCGSIIRGILAPSFRKGEFGGGLLRAVEVMGKLISGEEEVPFPPSGERARVKGLLGFFKVVLWQGFCAFFGLAVAGLVGLLLIGGAALALDILLFALRSSGSALAHHYGPLLMMLSFLVPFVLIFLVTPVGALIRERKAGALRRKYGRRWRAHMPWWWYGFLTVEVRGSSRGGGFGGGFGGFGGGMSGGGGASGGW